MTRSEWPSRTALPGIVPGVLAAAAIAAVATALAPYAPILGGPVIAILLGVAICSFVPLPLVLRAGITYSAKNILQGAIIVSGFGISV